MLLVQIRTCSLMAFGRANHLLTEHLMPQNCLSGALRSFKAQSPTILAHALSNWCHLASVLLLFTANNGH